MRIMMWELVGQSRSKEREIKEKEVAAAPFAYYLTELL